MICPFCFHSKTAVYNSRPTKRTSGLWRRRRCLSCGKEFTTRELVDSEGLLAVHTTNKKPVPFSKAKLTLSLIKVCDHRTDDAAYWLANTVEQKLIYQDSPHKEVSTDAIQQACLAVLKHFDTQAFIKYLSYHSDLSDTKALKQQLRAR